MKYILIASLMLSACSAMPQIADDIEKIATEDAITLKVTKDAISRDTDLNINIGVSNKDPKPVPAK